MSTNVGLWIDHKKAVIVTITENDAVLTHLDSEVDSQLRRTGDSPLQGSFESSQVPPDDRRQRAFTGHLNVYYDGVVDSIREAESLLLFGPGEAKTELKARLEKHHLADRIVGVETEDKMTDPQIIAYVKKHFDDK